MCAPWQETLTDYGPPLFPSPLLRPPLVPQLLQLVAEMEAAAAVTMAPARVVGNLLCSTPAWLMLTAPAAAASLKIPSVVLLTVVVSLFACLL